MISGMCICIYIYLSVHDEVFHGFPSHFFIRGATPCNVRNWAHGHPMESGKSFNGASCVVGALD